MKNILFKILLVCLLHLQPVVFADVIDIVPKTNYDDGELEALCSLPDMATEKDYLEILNSPEVPRRKECRVGVVEYFSWKCRSVNDEDEFLICMDELANHIHNLSAFGSPGKILLFGDLFIKMSKIYEEKGDFLNAAKTVEQLYYMNGGDILKDSILNNIGRLYYLAREYEKSEDVTKKWLILVESNLQENGELENSNFNLFKAHIMLVEINIALEDYIDAALYLKNLHELLLKNSSDCFIFAWYDLIRLREDVERKISKNKQGYYTRIMKIYNKIENTFDTIDIYSTKKKDISLLQSIESDVIELSFVCPKILDNYKSIMISGHP